MSPGYGVGTMIVLFNKPYGVLCQFTGEGRANPGRLYRCERCLPGGPAGHRQRGLLVLTDDGRLQNRISHPHHKLPKTYRAQVEGMPTPEALEQSRARA